MYQVLNLPSELNIAHFVIPDVPNFDDFAHVGIDLGRLLSEDLSNCEMMAEWNFDSRKLPMRTACSRGFSHHQERNRAVASLFSLVWLLRDPYASFTLPQAPMVRMSH